MMSVSLNPGDGQTTLEHTNQKNMMCANKSFSFRKRTERVNWKKIACVDIDQVAKDLDFNALQENIMNIAFCNIDAEFDTGLVDPHFVKLYKMAQLIIEYMLHSQDHLSGMLATVEQSLSKRFKEDNEMQKQIEKQKSEINEVRFESHKRKKMLLAQQQIMNAGVNSYHKCYFCPKAFVSNTFLLSHLQRRHPDHVGKHASQNISQPNIASNKMAEMTPKQNLDTQLNDNKDAAMLKEMGEINERLRLAELQLVEERNNHNLSVAKERKDADKKEKQSREEMEEWKESYMDSQSQELEKMRTMFMKELKDMTEKCSVSTQDYEILQHESRTNLGAMLDEHDDERQQMKHDQDEIMKLKENLEMKLDEMQSSMSSKFKDQESRWKDKLGELSKSHRKEMQQINSAFGESVDQLNKERRQRSDIAIEYKHKLEEMNKVVKISRSQALKLKEQEQHMEEICQKAAASVAAIRSPPKLLPSEPAGLSADEVDEVDEDGNEESGSDESSEFGDTTLATTYNATGTLSMGTGTLKVISMRLLHKLEKDPNLLRVMKEELTGVLDNNLEKRGVPINARGITSAMLQDKLHILKSERHQLGKKYTNLYDIRQQYIKQIDDVSREQLKKKKLEAAQATGPMLHTNRLPKTTSPCRPLSPTRQLNQETVSSAKAQVSPRRQANAKRSLSQKQAVSGNRPRSPTRPMSPQRPPTTRTPPKPAARTTSPQGKLLSTMSTMTSTGTFGTNTGSQSTWGDVLENMHGHARTSTVESDQWDSDEPSEYAGVLNHDVDGRSTPSPRKAVDSVTISPSTKEDESDWDDASDMQEADQDVSHISLNTPPQPKGPNVAKLVQKISGQLGGAGKKPVGGVATVHMSHSKTSKKTDDSWDDDDDDFSVSSLDASLTGSAPPSRNASFNRKSALPSDASTGTSVWGSSRASRSSLVSGTM